MPDHLQRYRQKRDFRITSEPQGSAAAGEGLSFVVQKHAARRLHYDFRLELDGVLKSWAVPKGPSLDPADKRMAVHVEDHPLDYGGFEGVIPPGQYGAGTVIVWDRGIWEPVGDPHEGYRQGKLKFDLYGEKLQGRWTLVRMHGRAGEKQEPWLLIKERDEAARPASEYNIVEELPDSVLGAGSKAKKPARKKTAKRARSKLALPAQARKAELPLTLSPMLATLVDEPPKRGEWVYEVKFDGYRLLARVEGGDIALFTRNGHDWTSKLKSLARAIDALQLPDCWLDGEIVVQNDQGVPDFQALQNAFDTSRTQDILYYVFDLPYCDGHDLRAVPLRERRALLQRLLQAHPQSRVRYSEDFNAPPEELLDAMCRLRMEGLIGKKADSAYTSRRSPAWIKLKCMQRQEFVIGGYTDPQGSRIGFGSLLLGLYDEQGRLHYAGNVGTGFNDKLLQSLSARLEALRTDEMPFADKPTRGAGFGAGGGKPHWVKPKLVAEVSFGEWTRDGRIRHPVFHGLRTDKPAKAITREKPMHLEEAPAKRKAATKTRAAAKLPAGLKVTNPERVIDPSTGITKLELVQYYARVAPLILPHLKGRPVSLVRAPSGIEGQHIFQKHGAPIPGITHLDPKYDRDHDPLMEIASAEALLNAAQQNCVEYHTWNSTTKAIDQPDRMTFDLDPGEGLKWPQMQEGALLVHGFLEELGLRSFLKTSGGKGLHVIVPLKPGPDYETVKEFSKVIVEHLARHVPQRFVAKSGPKNRVGKIFADYLRNGRGATTVAAWSARARPGMGVSVPVEWDELPQLRSGDHWTIRTIDERLEIDAWREYGKAQRQTLTRAAKALDFELPPAKAAPAKKRKRGA